MKKDIIILVLLFNLLNVKAQSNYSKLFDLNGEWEAFTNMLKVGNNSLSMFCNTREIFASDSTRFDRMVLIKFDENFKIINETTIGKNFYKPTLPMLTDVLKNKFIYGLIDTTQNNLKYFICSYDSNLNILSTIPVELQSKSQVTYPNNVYFKNNKLYFFCADFTTFVASKLKLSIQCTDTNGNLLWGKVFNNNRCYTNNVVQTKDGNFILAGLKYYGEGLGGDDSAFAWYAKVDTLGNILWEKVLDRNSELMTVATAITKAGDNYFLTGTQSANYERRFESTYGDTSFCFMAKINEQTGGIIWQKRFLYNVNKIRGLNDGFGNFIVYKNGYLYALISHNVNTPSEEYIMFAKFDLQGNILWKRLFQQATYSNRFYSLTPIADGFLICADGKDSTRAKGDSDAWLIKTDSNGCIIPGCNAKDGIVQIINPEKVFTVYPNPAQNEINVSSINVTQKIENLAVYNMQGQLLKSINTKASNQQTINIEDLVNGNYLLIITTDKQQMAGKKFVVER